MPVLLLAVIAYAACVPDSGLRTWLRLQGDLRAAEVRVARVRGEVEALEREVVALRSDRFALERALREDLGWARPGETIVRAPRAEDSSHRFH